MKGIILAGGDNTKLYPLTNAYNKHLLPVYNKPMIYYPLSTLMMAGIRDIMIVTSTSDIASFEKLLGDGSQFGVSIQYKAQLTPNGPAHAFLMAEEFIGDDECALIFGDNIFYGPQLSSMLKQVSENKGRATMFGYYVQHPEHYGVVEFSNSGSVISLEEKPRNPRSHYAVTGLYFYDKNAMEYAHQIAPTRQGKLEIMDLNQTYLEKDLLDVKILENGFTWIDAGSLPTLGAAMQFVAIMEGQTHMPVCSPEAIAFLNGWITRGQLLDIISRYAPSPYAQILRAVADGRITNI